MESVHQCTTFMGLPMKREMLNQQQVSGHGKFFHFTACALFTPHLYVNISRSQHHYKHPDWKKSILRYKESTGGCVWRGRRRGWCWSLRKIGQDWMKCTATVVNGNDGERKLNAAWLLKSTPPIQIVRSLRKCWTWKIFGDKFFLNIFRCEYGLNRFDEPKWAKVCFLANFFFLLCRAHTFTC